MQSTSTHEAKDVADQTQRSTNERTSPQQLFPVVPSRNSFPSLYATSPSTFLNSYTSSGPSTPATRISSTSPAPSTPITPSISSISSTSSSSLSSSPPNVSQIGTRSVLSPAILSFIRKYGPPMRKPIEPISSNSSSISNAESNDTESQALPLQHSSITDLPETEESVLVPQDGSNVEQYDNITPIQESLSGPINNLPFQPSQTSPSSHFHQLPISTPVLDPLALQAPPMQSHQHTQPYLITEITSCLKAKPEQPLESFQTSTPSTPCLPHKVEHFINPSNEVHQPTQVPALTNQEKVVPHSQRDQPDQPLQRARANHLNINLPTSISSTPVSPSPPSNPSTPSIPLTPLTPSIPLVPSIPLSPLIPSIPSISSHSSPATPLILIPSTPLTPSTPSIIPISSVPSTPPLSTIPFTSNSITSTFPLSTPSNHFLVSYSSLPKPIMPAVCFPIIIPGLSIEHCEPPLLLEYRKNDETQLINTLKIPPLPIPQATLKESELNTSFEYNPELQLSLTNEIIPEEIEMEVEMGFLPYQLHLQNDVIESFDIDLYPQNNNNNYNNNNYNNNNNNSLPNLVPSTPPKETSTPKYMRAFDHDNNDHFYESPSKKFREDFQQEHFIHSYPDQPVEYFVKSEPIAMEIITDDEVGPNQFNANNNGTRDTKPDPPAMEGFVWFELAMSGMLNNRARLPRKLVLKPHLSNRRHRVLHPHARERPIVVKSRWAVDESEEVMYMN